MAKHHDKALKKRILSYNTDKWLVTEQNKKLNSNKDRRAIIYCRVSSKKQVTEWNWLETQERNCRERCASQTPPIIVDKVFKEPWISGKVTDRKEFNRLVQYLKTKNKDKIYITHFVANEYSRICRPENMIDALAMEEKIKQYWVIIKWLDMVNIDDSTDEWEFMKNIQYVIAWYERRKIAKRAQDWRKNRLLSWYRPFPNVPVWYIRNYISKRDYVDIFDEKKSHIIKEWLELYANNLIVSDADLRRFRKSKWLLTNAKSAKKLHRTFIEKTMQLHKIMYYAWYIIYPERWVDEIIEWRHKWIISLETANKIIDKLKNKHNWKWLKTKAKDDKINILRGIISCSECWRRLTSWNTTKRVWPKWEKSIKKYPYYGCNNKECDARVNIKQEKLEEQFEDLLLKLKLPNRVVKLIEVIFHKRRIHNKEQRNKDINTKKRHINRLQTMKNDIESRLIQTSNIKLYNKLEEQRASIDVEIAEIEKDIESDLHNEERMQSTLQKVINLLANPLVIWNMWSKHMRSLLIWVRFWDSLQYTKKEWLKTVWGGTLFDILASLKGDCSDDWALRDSNPGPAA